MKPFIIFLFISLVNLIKTNKLNRCRLPNPSQYGVGIGFPRVQNRVKSLGIMNVTMLFVDFKNAPANRTTRDVLSIISPEAEKFFFKNSYGKLQVKLLPNLKWLRMSKNSSEYNMSPKISFNAQKSYISEAVSLAKGWDFSTSQMIVVITNPNVADVPYGPTFSPNSGQGIVVNGKVFENAVNSGKDLLYWKSFWFNHEVSHSMGLPDLYSFSGGLQFRFTGSWSIMGNINSLGREYFAWERWLLGWIEDSQVICLSDTKFLRVNLTAIEIPNGIKMVVVPITVSSAVVVESRKKYGYDDKIVRQGILVYVVDSHKTSGNGPIRVLPINDNDEKKLNATLSIGSQLVYNNVKINYESSFSTIDTITILRT
ncbi:unnamed protein product [Brachionus calyciflorus]|uniref:M6 metalloprotease n=1 Tax=Brachionus calyciflorus TaxID=104777 RepID=A0A813RQU3_9BILA|nr:unnamed protein product [Brachionus calyciflorus]